MKLSTGFNHRRYRNWSFDVSIGPLRPFEAALPSFGLQAGDHMGIGDPAVDRLHNAEDPEEHETSGEEELAPAFE